ncbi:hypothetical protein [Hymenobacter monticola]|uniref:hypothetical protein n=1 Tax=Hymenobacter monticola TaxID=1705399 RepID=UPI0036D2E249
MLPVFRVHVHQQGSRWVWELRQGQGPAARTQTGNAATRAEAVRAALSPASFRAGVQEPYYQQAA